MRYIGVCLFMILTLHSITSEAYFSYSDCSNDCQRRHLPCIMIKSIGGMFTTMCVERIVCENQADSETPCISEDRPTIGGVRLWVLYKNRVIPPRPTTPRPTAKPTPRPVVENCNRWKILSAIQSSLSFSMIVFFGLKKFMRYRFRRGYEPINDQQEANEQVDSPEPIQGGSSDIHPYLIIKR